MTPTPTSARLQALEVVDKVIDAHKEQIGTHSMSCWKYHAGCLAVLIRNTLETES